MTKPLTLNQLAFILLICLGTVAPSHANTTSKSKTETNIQDQTQSQPQQSIDLQGIEWQWADNEHQDMSNRLDNWANEMNSWFGEPDPNKPATASLRIIVDTRWADDPITGSHVDIDPRVRGRLRLPVLERHLSLLIGDEDLDEETVQRQDSAGQAYNDSTHTNGKVIDKKNIRDDNTSIALRWSEFGDTLGIDTDVDVGIHSIDDLYIKVDIEKDIYEQDALKVTSDAFYRYGTQSNHYVKGKLNTYYSLNDNRYLSNVSTIRYRHKNNEETMTWVNDLRQVHNLANNKQLSYGVSASGNFSDDANSLNSYGASISYRQPIWREWLSVQTELHYYNDKAGGKEHFPSALLRFEALF